MDHLFSSPEKSTKKVNGKGKTVDATISSEEEMEMVESMETGASKFLVAFILMRSRHAPWNRCWNRQETEIRHEDAPTTF